MGDLEGQSLVYEYKWRGWSLASGTREEMMAELLAGETLWSLLLHWVFSLKEEASLGQVSVVGMGNGWKVSVQGAVHVIVTALNGCSQCCFMAYIMALCVCIKFPVVGYLSCFNFLLLKIKWNSVSFFFLPVCIIYNSFICNSPSLKNNTMSVN